MSGRRSLLKKLYRKVEELAFDKSEDVLSLARGLEDGSGDGGLDLRMISEIRRSKDGVDIKLADRAKLIEVLVELGEKLDSDGEGFLESLLRSGEDE